ncbi:MAG: pili assembly chaperone, partial [Microcystis panniformis]
SYRAEAKTQFTNDIRNYAGGVRLLTDGRLFTIICEARSTSQDNVFVTDAGGCSPDGIALNDLSSTPMTGPM